MTYAIDEQIELGDIFTLTLTKDHLQLFSNRYTEAARNHNVDTTNYDHIFSSNYNYWKGISCYYSFSHMVYFRSIFKT